MKKQVVIISSDDRKEYDYTFQELKKNALNVFDAESDYFSLVMYSNEAPLEGDKVLVNSNIYKVDSVTDCTDDAEEEAGLSYSKIYLLKTETEPLKKLENNQNSNGSNYLPLTLERIIEIVDETKDLSSDEQIKVAYSMPITASGIYVLQMEARHNIRVSI